MTLSVCVCVRACVRACEYLLCVYAYVCDCHNAHTRARTCVSHDSDNDQTDLDFGVTPLTD